MITDATENALIYRRIIVKASSKKYPNRRGVIVGISKFLEEIFVHVTLDSYRNAPARRREMFPIESLTVLPKGETNGKTQA